MHLQNVVMQLRKVCSHPYLFDWPLDENNQYVLDDQLINASGKMLLLNRLLDELFERGHKVLVFSQFTTMLDIIGTHSVAQWPMQLTSNRGLGGRIQGMEYMSHRRQDSSP
jgi:hypothetical protein